MFKKSWSEKTRKVDVFDVKSDVIKTLLELGLKENDLKVSSNSKSYYHPGRSGSVNCKKIDGPTLAFLVSHLIISKLDFKEKNIYGFEIFNKNISEPHKIKNS